MDTPNEYDESNGSEACSDDDSNIGKKVMMYIQPEETESKIGMHGSVEEKVDESLDWDVLSSSAIEKDSTLDAKVSTVSTSKIRNIARSKYQEPDDGVYDDSNNDDISNNDNMVAFKDQVRGHQSDNSSTNTINAWCGTVIEHS